MLRSCQAGQAADATSEYIAALLSPRFGQLPAEPQASQSPQLLLKLRSIPQAGRFLGVLCLFTFSMFLNDAVLEPYGAAVFGMSVCATTSLNVLIALGFFGGLGLSGFWLIERVGNIRTARVGAVLAALALMMMLWAGAEQSIPLLRAAVGLFGLWMLVSMPLFLYLQLPRYRPRVAHRFKTLDSDRSHGLLVC